MLSPNTVCAIYTCAVWQKCKIIEPPVWCPLEEINILYYSAPQQLAKPLVHLDQTDLTNYVLVELTHDKEALLVLEDPSIKKAENTVIDAGVFGLGGGVQSLCTFCLYSGRGLTRCCSAILRIVISAMWITLDSRCLVGLSGLLRQEQVY